MTYSAKIREAIDTYAAEQMQGEGRKSLTSLFSFQEVKEVRDVVSWEQLKESLEALCRAHSDAVALVETGQNRWLIQSKHNKQESSITFDGRRYRIFNFRSIHYALGDHIEVWQSILQADGKAVFFTKN